MSNQSIAASVCLLERGHPSGRVCGTCRHRREDFCEERSKANWRGKWKEFFVGPEDHCRLWKHYEEER